MTERKYVIYDRTTRKAAMVTNPNWDGEYWERYLPGSKSINVSGYRVDGAYNGIPFTEELASIDGMWFGLFPDGAHTKADVAKAKKMIRNDRDVVSMTVYRVKWAGAHVEPKKGAS